MTRADLITEFLEGITSAPFQPPRALSGDDAGQIGHVDFLRSAVQEALPHRLNPEQASAALRDARRDIALSSVAMTWPKPREVAEAIRRRVPAKPQTHSDDAILSAKTSWARRWWNDKGDLGVWASDGRVIRALVAEGVSARALWNSGADVPRDLREWTTQGTLER